MWVRSHAAFRLFVYYGDVDMYDKTLIAHLLPPEMIIKNFIRMKTQQDLNHKLVIIIMDLKLKTMILIVINMMKRLCWKLVKFYGF